MSTLVIRGLSRVVIVVEAGEGSGALHTAHHAAEQGRTVMAVPGPVDSAASAGCNALIRNGVVLCRHVDDVLEELHGVSTVEQTAKTAAAPTLTVEKARRRDLPMNSAVSGILAGGAKTVDEMASSYNWRCNNWRRVDDDGNEARRETLARQPL